MMIMMMNFMVMQNERGQDTHGQGEWVKTPLFPNNIGKKSVNDAGPQQGHNNDDDAKRH